MSQIKHRERLRERNESARPNLSHFRRQSHIGDLPPVQRQQEPSPDGQTEEGFTAGNLAGKLNQLTRTEIEHFKKNAGKAAQELNAEANALKINKMISEVLH